MSRASQRSDSIGDVTNVSGRNVTVRIPYNVPDSYSTSWRPGCFADSLRGARAIPVVFNHDEGRVVGKVTGHRETPGYLELDIRLADPDAVPDARAAQSLLRDGMVDGVSFRFGKGAVTEPDPVHRGVLRFVRAHLWHVSFVVAASIPGAMVTSVRSAQTARPVSAAEMAMTRARLAELATLRHAPARSPARSAAPAQLPPGALAGWRQADVEEFLSEPIPAALPPAPEIPADILDARPEHMSMSEARAAWEQSWREQHGVA